MNKTEPISGAEALIKCLLAEGIDTAFGYPGGAIMPVYDALYKYQNSLHHILTRHEQGAIHAAQGYARATGKVGVVFATSGPGATNIITGIADAQIDSTPLVCITGQVAKHLLGTDAFQETDIIGISTPVTKWNYQISKVEELPATIAKAFYIAKSGRPGPVLIDITKNAQFDVLPSFSYQKCKSVRSYQPLPPINKKNIEMAAQLINEAKKPYVIFGQGIILGKAENELKEFIEKTDIPAASTALGLSALPSSHPNFVGMVGMHGNYGTNVLTNECDLLISLGMRFDDRVTGNLKQYAKQAKIIHFDIDPSEIDKNVKTNVAVLGNIKDTLQLIIPLVNENKHSQWHKAFKKYYEIEFEQVIRKELFPSEGKIKMGEVIELINQATKNDAVIVSDVGQHQMMACRYAKFHQSHSKITSGGLGTMGFALPAAIGAKIGKPEREVVAIIGDGGFQMTIQELGTILQTKAAVKIVILNNEFLGMVRQWQELFFDKRYASTVMVNPNFIKIAQGYGIKAQRVSSRENLEEAVQEMIQSEQAYLLEILVEKESNVFPMVPTGASVADVLLK